MGGNTENNDAHVCTPEVLEPDYVTVSAEVQRDAKKASIHWETLTKLLSIGATLGESSAVMGVTSDVLDSLVRRKYNISFSDFRQHCLHGLRVSIRKATIRAGIEKLNVKALEQLREEYLSEDLDARKMLRMGRAELVKLATGEDYEPEDKGYTTSRKPNQHQKTL